jgi:hypothetical protein
MGELAREQRHIARRSAHHEPHDWLCGLDALERVHTEEQTGERGDLVGGHQPRAHRQQHHKLGDECHHAQAP